MYSKVKIAASLVILLSLMIFIAPATAPARAAELQKGYEAYKNKNWDLAAKELEPAAVEGDFNAQFLLAELYLRGDGKEQNFEQAFYWYFEAAKSGHPQAQANAGSLLSLGLGVPREMPSAYYWWILSAIWTENELTRGAFAALGEVAPLLNTEERQLISASGKAAWQQGVVEGE